MPHPPEEKRSEPSVFVPDTQDGIGPPIAHIKFVGDDPCTGTQLVEEARPEFQIRLATEIQCYHARR